MIAHSNNSALSVISSFSRDEIDVIKASIAKDCTDDELKYFLAICTRSGLNPIAKQIYALKRSVYDNDINGYKKILSIQVGIDGLRLIAQRTGKYRGQIGAYWCGGDGKWLDVWLADEPPAAAKIAVLHSDFNEPLWKVARFKSYAQYKKDNSTLVPMWAKMGDIMLAKCAEALALRAAFPQECSGLYTQEEMQQADVHQQAQSQSELKQIYYIPEVPIEDPLREFKNKIADIMRERNIKTSEAKKMLQERYKAKSRDELSIDQLEDFIIFLKSLPLEPLETPEEILFDEQG